MRIGRTDSFGEPFHFFRIKDLHFFKHLLWRYDLALLKDYLHRELQLFNIPSNSQQCLLPTRVYIPNEQARIKAVQGKERTVIRAGHAFPENICEFCSQNDFTLYSISKQSVFVLEKLYFLDLPLMNGMKSSQKFTFLQRCELIQLQFNSFVYRRGEDVDAIYYLLEGQIKMFKELGESFYQVASLEQGRLFGIFQVKGRSKQRELYAKASMNTTKLLKIPLKLAERACLEKESTLESILFEAQSEIYSMLPKRKGERKTLAGKAQGRMMDSSTRVQLQRRLKTFQSNRMIQSSVIENLVYSKKMLYRVKELNQRMQTCNNRPPKLQAEDPHAVRHFNDKWKCQKDQQKVKPSRTRDLTMGIKKTPFKRLLKYPSVQRFLGFESAIPSVLKSSFIEEPPASTP